MTTPQLYSLLAHLFLTGLLLGANLDLVLSQGLLHAPAYVLIYACVAVLPSVLFGMFVECLQLGSKPNAR